MFLEQLLVQEEVIRINIQSNLLFYHCSKAWLANIHLANKDLLRLSQVLEIFFLWSKIQSITKIEDRHSSVIDCEDC